MSDAPIPPASVPPPTDPAPRPRRAWTILGRLSQAIREQNWFAVVLEVLIVIVGVVIGFQVTSWGQDRADRAQEQTYLRQLVEDLEQTEQTYKDMEPDWIQRDASIAALVRSFRSASTPPVDSVLVWAGRVVVFHRPTIVTGTADALVATGDLNLIRDDSLRSSITSYLNVVEQQRDHMGHMQEEATPYIRTLTERVDFLAGWFGEEGGWFGGIPPAVRDTMARSWPFSPYPEAPHRTIRPLDMDALFRDPLAYSEMSNLWRLRFYFQRNRVFVVAQTVALREQIEAELDR
jgi:hypothetical protein